MAAQNNLHIPDDLLSAANEAASADGKTTDELAVDALQRYPEPDNRPWALRASSRRLKPGPGHRTA